MKRVMVTGGAGFIGGSYVRGCLARGDQCVINLDKLTYAGNLDSLSEVMDHPNHVFVEGDICDAALVQRLFKQYRPQAIVHFAAESHVDRSIESPAAFLQTNVNGTVTLLEAALQFYKSSTPEEQRQFRFLQVSTDEVYGSLGNEGYFREDTPYQPNSPYAASKAAADHFVRAFQETYGLPTLLTNCSNNYGPFQFPEKLIPLMVLNAIEGKPLPVYGDGQNVRDWLYVEDHCDAIRTVLERGQIGEKYNIGGNSERTNLDVVTTICGLVDELASGLGHAPCESLITFVQDRPGHDHRYAIDAGKLLRELGWQPSKTFEAGLRETVQWYLDNMNWVQGVTSGSYQRQRLGLERIADGPNQELATATSHSI